MEPLAAMLDHAKDLVRIERVGPSETAKRRLPLAADGV